MSLFFEIREGTNPPPAPPPQMMSLGGGGIVLMMKYCEAKNTSLAVMSVMHIYLYRAGNQFSF